MFKGIKKAWDIYREISDFKGLLLALGLWKWVALVAASTMTVLLAISSYLPLWVDVLISLAAVGLLLFISGYAVVLWRVVRAEEYTSGPDLRHAAIAAPSVKAPVPTELTIASRTLEALVESPLIVGQSGSVLAAVPVGIYSELEQVVRNGRYSSLNWGALQCSDCEIPFRRDGQIYLPATVEFRLVSLDFQSASPIQVELTWNTGSRAIEFLVKAMTPGIRKAQVQLWARRKLRGSVVVQADTTEEDATSEQGGSALNLGDLEMVATVEVKVMVLENNQSFKRSHEQSIEPPGHGYSIGM